MFPTTILRLLLVFAALLFFVDTAAACTCFGARQGEGFHPCMTYASADAVFTGQVAEISYARFNPDGKPALFSEKVVHFTVDKAFKGVDGRTIEIVTNPNTASCGYDFKEGQRYFVYSRRDKDGKLKESLCGPTVPLEAAASDLAYMEELKGGVNGQRIVGAVVKLDRRDVKDYGTRSPVPGVEVILERGGEQFSKTVTNEEGRYEFRGLSEGDYRVRATLPSGLRVLSADGKPKDHYIYLREDRGCPSESFFLTTTSSIRGRIVPPEGSSLPQQYLELVPLDEKGNEISSALTPSVTSRPQNGGYYFRDVAPGRYLLAVNARNKPGKSDPVYPLMYYPGVTTRQRATVIEVFTSGEIDLEDFMLTPPLKERWFSGTVVLPDGAPAVGAKVILIDPNDRMTETNVAQVVADEQGRFRVRGYESFPYWIDAYVDTSERGIPMHAPPVQLATSGSVEGIKLVISLTYRSQPYHSN
jgi:SdrD B-like protein